MQLIFLSIKIVYQEISKSLNYNSIHPPLCGIKQIDPISMKPLSELKPKLNKPANQTDMKLSLSHKHITLEHNKTTGGFKKRSHQIIFDV